MQGESHGAEFGVRVLQLLILSVLLMISTSLNGILAIAIVRARRLHTASNYLIFSLVMSNFIGSAILVPLMVLSATSGTDVGTAQICHVSAFVHALMLTANNFIVAFIAVERYYAIVRPSKYIMCITKTRVLITIIFVWVAALLLILPPFITWEQGFAKHADMFICIMRWGNHTVYTSAVLVVLYLIPLCIMLCTYSYIYRVAKLQRSQEDLQISGEVEEPGTRLCRSVFTCRSKHEYRLAQRVPWMFRTYALPVRALKTTFLLLGCYQIKWTILLVWIVCEATSISSEALAYFAYVAVCLSYNLQALFYGFFNTTIRTSMNKQFCAMPKSDKSDHSVKSPLSIFESMMDFVPKKAGDDTVQENADGLEILRMRDKAEESTTSDTSSKRMSPRYSSRSPLRRAITMPAAVIQEMCLARKRSLPSPNRAGIIPLSVTMRSLNVLEVDGVTLECESYFPEDANTSSNSGI